MNKAFCNFCVPPRGDTPQPSMMPMCSSDPETGTIGEGSGEKKNIAHISMMQSPEPGCSEDVAEDAEGQQKGAVDLEKDIDIDPTMSADPVSPVSTAASTPSKRRRRSSMRVEDIKEFVANWRAARDCFLEMLVRAVPIGILLYAVVAGVGYLIYFASAHLLQQAYESGWTQIWSEHRSTQIEEEFMNQTYVQVYNAIHRDRTLDPSAPHYATRWIYAYYLRMSFVATVGFAVPWFTLAATQGWGRVKKYFLAIFIPQAIVLNAYGIAAAAYVDANGTTLVSDAVERVGGFMFALVQTFIAIPLVSRALGMQHYIKGIIIPYLLYGLLLLLFVTWCQKSFWVWRTIGSKPSSGWLYLHR